jgi:deoxyribose-phosphate aldolase
MYTEYCYFDISSNETEIKAIIGQAVKFPISSISVFSPYIKTIKSLIPNDIKLSSPIDYPLGLLDTKSRLSATECAIKQGVNTIDIVCPAYYLCNRKYDKFREDIKLLNTLCKNNGVELRYFLEYRIYNYELLYKISQILLDLEISTILPSSGYLLDDISDNVLASALINKKVAKINIIANGNIWNTNQVTMLEKSNLYGIRVNSLNGLSLLHKNSTK